jgi:hypothetical protein
VSASEKSDKFWTDLSIIRDISFSSVQSSKILLSTSLSHRHSSYFGDVDLALPVIQNTLAPPSTFKSAPLIKLPAELQSKIRGPCNSDGIPILPIGFLSFHILLALSSPSPSFRIVSM